LRIALVLLALCLGTSAAMDAFEPLPRLLNRLFVEGLVIAGWVVLWRPLDTLIFDAGAPLVEARCFEHLASMAVEVQERHPGRESGD